MKKIRTIYLILCVAILTVSCGGVIDHQIPSPSIMPIVDDYNTTEKGLKDAFLEDDEIRMLFETIASNSLPLLEQGRCHYDCNAEVFNCYSEVGDIVKTILVNAETAEAIRKLKEYYPDINIWLEYIEYSEENGRESVRFYINRKDIEISEDYFVEELCYTYSATEYFSKFGYEKIEENWYATTFFMPLPTVVP